VALTVIAGTVGPQSATLTLDMGEGKQQTVQATGNGPVDATFNAIIKLMPHKAKLALYQVHAVTEGTDAQAEASVRLGDEPSEGGRSQHGGPIQTRWWPGPRPMSRPSTNCSPSADACTLSRAPRPCPPGAAPRGRPGPSGAPRPGAVRGINTPTPARPQCHPS